MLQHFPHYLSRDDFLLTTIWAEWYENIPFFHKLQKQWLKLKICQKSVLHRNTQHRDNKCNTWQNDRQKQGRMVLSTIINSVTDSGSLWETPKSKQWNLELHRKSQETVDQDCPLIHYHRHCKLVSYKLEVHWSGTSNRPPHETG